MINVTEHIFISSTTFHGCSLTNYLSLNILKWMFGKKKLDTYSIRCSGLHSLSSLRTRLQWMSSFRTAIEYAGEAVRYQRSLFEKRKLGRDDEKEKEDEEFNRIMTMNNETIDHTKLELEQEKQVSRLE